MQKSTFALLLAPFFILSGCPSVSPPPSALPNAAAALARMHSTVACANGLQATAKVDHFGKQGRLRGDLLMIAAVPSQIRMDLISPFGVALATLTVDRGQFALADLREKRFFVGPASACNIARLTTVPLPSHVLVELLRGDAPVLKHEDASTTLAWDPHGYYVITIASTRDAFEEIHLGLREEDRNQSWTTQRMRLLDVLVRQKGTTLYHAELDDHHVASMAKERVDPEGLEPPISPSGPFCDAEIPHRIHVEVPGLDEDVLFRYDQVVWNPPIPEGTFAQPVFPGMTVTPETCE